MTAYYNEIDKHAAEWLRNLIAAGHIAPGIVDTRDIRDVRPADLRGFTQCHFFAGIGVWSYALRRAGWPDDRAIWTGSCPCQPFSAAGRGAGFADERHLWPAWFWLIEQCRPHALAGEQVASPAGIRWLDLVQSDMEGIGYACGAVDIPAAGVGAPHLRQRAYFVADRARDGWREERALTGRELAGNCTQGLSAGLVSGGDAGELADNSLGGRAQGRGSFAGDERTRDRLADDGVHGELAEPDLQRREGFGVQLREREPRSTVLEAGGCGEVGGLVYPAGVRSSGGREDETRKPAEMLGAGHEHLPSRQPATGPTNGFWRDADWLFCRDGKWRPVDPGTFPLAHGLAGRVGRLRAYGNAIVADQAEAVIRAFDEVRHG